MKDIFYYYFEEFALAVDSGTYLVTMFQPAVKPVFYNVAMDLPDWVFHSSFAIWFGESGVNAYERSLNGELVRAALLAKRIEEELCRDYELDRSFG